MYSALIIDDEADARSALSQLLKLFCPQFTSIVEARTGQEAVAQADRQSFDLAFIDIHLNNENGLDLAPRLKGKCRKLVFVTAYDQYAVEAFQTEAVHYLLKPVDPTLLQQAVEKARLESTALPTEQLQDRLLLNTKNGIEVLDLDNIAYVQGSGNYCTFYLRTGESIFISKHLAHYQKELQPPRFHRIHQSYLVNLEAVHRFLVDDGYFAILENNQKLPVARRRKDEFVAALGKIGRRT